MPTGNDVWQVKLLMNALGYFRPDDQGVERTAQSMIYDGEIAQAVDTFRDDQGLSNPRSGGTPSGFVDADLATLMWDLVEETGRALDVRKTIRDATRIRR